MQSTSSSTSQADNSINLQQIASPQVNQEFQPAPVNFENFTKQECFSHNDRSNEYQVKENKPLEQFQEHSQFSCNSTATPSEKSLVAHETLPTLLSEKQSEGKIESESQSEQKSNIAKCKRSHKKREIKEGSKLMLYDQNQLSNDIERELKNKLFTTRDEVINCVREFGNHRGFGICIPRGDIVLQDKTLQITLYCHQYGNKRNRSSLRFQDRDSTVNSSHDPQEGANDGNETIIQDDEDDIQDPSKKFGGSCKKLVDLKPQSKKTNCPFRMKFVKQPDSNFFEFFQAIHGHNHDLVIGSRLKNHSNYHKKPLHQQSESGDKKRGTLEKNQVSSEDQNKRSGASEAKGLSKQLQAQINSVSPALDEYQSIIKKSQLLRQFVYQGGSSRSGDNTSSIVKSTNDEEMYEEQQEDSSVDTNNQSRPLKIEQLTPTFENQYLFPYEQSQQNQQENIFAQLIPPHMEGDDQILHSQDAQQDYYQLDFTNQSGAFGDNSLMSECTFGQMFPKQGRNGVANYH
ncbi:hypothetical protein FGO68_gene15337 [Halteria grandinella]|uniref:Uncharacterized protein n=1 Tax=Halteria grandinella TaxID=5974 RepID=A0A8J8T6T9_HALGN|nr:hypothetical protein FGO68_gene15337 [Halteria grandinella]